MYKLLLNYFIYRDSLHVFFPISWTYYYRLRIYVCIGGTSPLSRQTGGSPFNSIHHGGGSVDDRLIVPSDYTKRNIKGIEKDIMRITRIIRLGGIGTP